MGQGSRGGNSGLSSSGVRQRRDKEAQGERIVINNKNSNSAQGGKGGRGGRRGFPGNGLNGGFPNLGLPNLGGSGNKSGGKKGSQNKGKTTPPPPATKQNKLKKITRIKPVRVKLTKQRTNKTPN